MGKAGRVWRTMTLVVFAVVALFIGGLGGGAAVLSYAQKRADEVVASKLQEIGPLVKNHESMVVEAKQAGKTEMQDKAREQWEPLQEALKAWREAARPWSWRRDEETMTAAETALKKAFDDHAAKLEALTKKPEAGAKQAQGK